MKKWLPLLLLLGSLFSPALWAQTSGNTWRLLSPTENTTYLYKPSTVVRQNGRVSVWIKSEPILWKKVEWQDGYKDILYLTYGSLSHILHKYEFACTARKSRVLYVTYYDENGNVLRSFSFKEIAEWNEIVPDSVGEDWFNKFCRR